MSGKFDTWAFDVVLRTGRRTNMEWKYCIIRDMGAKLTSERERLISETLRAIAGDSISPASVQLEYAGDPTNPEIRVISRGAIILLFMPIQTAFEGGMIKVTQVAFKPTQLTVWAVMPPAEEGDKP